MTKTQENEINLLIKWAELIEGMLPHLKPKNNGFCLMKSRKMENYEQLHYSRYQLEYISLVLWSILNVRKKILKSETTLAFKSDIYENEARVEDVIYLTIILMDQARYHYMKNMKQDKKQSKFERQYVLHTSKFIDLIREDPNIKSLNLEEDIVVVGTIVNMLHRAVDFEEKYIGRVLQPYLKDLYEISFVISWHLEDIKRRLNDDELKSLGCFCKLVNSGEITPEQGLEDALEKNWTWAKDMMELIEKREVRIFLIPDREKVNQYVVYPNEKSSGDTKRRNLPKRKDTLLGRNYFNTLRSKDLEEPNDDNIPQQELLKIKSPLTSIISRIHRRGIHRGCGDTFMSLIHMRKMGVYQEITSTLSEEEKINLNETIDEILETRNRNCNEKNWTNTLPRVHKNISFTPKGDVQMYKPMEESAGIREKELQNEQPGYETLIRKCRTLRMKENDVYFPSVSDTNKKEMLRKSQSFKY